MMSNAENQADTNNREEFDDDKILGVLSVSEIRDSGSRLELVPAPRGSTAIFKIPSWSIDEFGTS